MTPQQYGMVLAGLVAALVIAHLLGRSQRDKHSPINFEDLFIGDDGRMSKASTVMLGSFVVTTWMMVELTLSGKLTEGYLGLYMAAWVAPTVTSLIVNAGVKRAQANAEKPELPPSITQNLTVTPKEGA